MLVWHACGAEPIFVCAARVQHTCVTCAGVHVCSMYAVYMPNMCMHVFCIPHVLVCGMFQFLPARASEQGNVIGLVSVYIYIYIYMSSKKNCN